MAPPTVQTLQRLAAETGYRLDAVEKVLRLLELLDEIAQDPVLSQCLALKGGTALNVFYLDLDRLSVDIDLNYVGALDVAAMERDRLEVDAAIDRLFASQGYGVRRRPTGHAGGKWLARFTSALGGNASLELDLNYMARQPLFGAARMGSRTLGRVGTGRVLVLDLHEIAAGKVVALFDRGAARDLFRDAGNIDAWIAQSLELCREGLAFLFELSENERRFLDRGEVNANLLGVERELGTRIAAMPMLAWKCKHVRRRRGLEP